MTSDVYCNEAVKSPVQPTVNCRGTEQHGTVGPTCCCVGGYGSTRNRRICKYWEIEEMWMYFGEFGSMRVIGDFVSSGCEYLAFLELWEYWEILEVWKCYEILEVKSIGRL